MPTENINNQTLARTMEPINKLGFMDGSSDGQTVTFQASFDKGYKLGLQFGFELGFSDAILGLQNKSNTNQLNDAQHINCQICLNGTKSQDSIVNLYNAQKEMNVEYFATHIFNSNR